MFNLTSEELVKKQAVHTASEIYQQPVVWRELLTESSQEKDNLRKFIKSIFEKHENVRVIFTGAGTSAFAGDTIVPELSKQYQGKVQFEAVATTDIVSNPTEYLFKDVPTIMVSFARSGNSPESVAAVSLGQEIIKDFYQVVITCNKNGQLAKNIHNDDNGIITLMPERANDKSLAMTSSFTTMLMAAYSLFSVEALSKSEENQIIGNAEHLVDSITRSIDGILDFDFRRIIYLGSGLLGKLSHEAALKMLEMSAGQVVAIHDSSLGFRHGPKSILNEKSIVVLFMSQDSYTRKYDLDILRELAMEESGVKVVAVTEKKDEEIEELADWVIPVNFGATGFSSDFHLGMIYIIFAQALAMKKSIQLGNSPDNPSPNGLINRVVKGVIIHNFK